MASNETYVSMEAVDSGTTRDWWVLQTTSRREPIVCRQLAMQGVEHYAPEFPPRARTRPGSVRDRRSRMIFPGYVFCRPPECAGAHVALKRAPGVVRILSADGIPASLPDAVVSHLRRRLAEQVAGCRGSGFRRGQRVVIESGPMASLDAIFDRDLHPSARVRILVEIMGRSVPMDLDPTDLRSLAT